MYLAKFTSMVETTFQYQKDIQKLPIPDIVDTCQKYLEIVQPLQSEKEHKQTKKAVDQFLDSKTAQKLDDLLRDYSKDKASYIEEFWYDAYLNYDNPVVLNLNPFFLIEDDPNPVRPSQVARAAEITISSLRFVRALRREELPPDKVRGKPLDMDQYKNLFATARIPSEKGCVMKTDETSSHIVVLSRSQFYWFNVLDEKSDIILSENAIKENFKEIIADSNQTKISDIAKSSFGLLTTENRRLWADIREGICSQTQSVNAEIIKIIDTALFIVCLDDVEVESLEEISVNMLCGILKLEKGVQVGTCTNRWYDKIQIIVTRNSKVGINFEHTGVDGHTVLRFVSDIYTDSILRFARSVNQNSPSIWTSKSPDPENLSAEDLKGLVITPTKLEWDLTPDLSLSLRFAETRLSDLIQQTEFAILEFKGYGSDYIKKLGCSPDAFVQMSFQAAYYSLYGKVECTYEPAMTKGFLHGRTEAIRTVSNESNLFVRKFFENISAKEKLAYLTAACKKHSQRTRDAASGLGVDRHLYALFCIWKKYTADDPDTDESGSDVTVSEVSKELPLIFANSAWDKLNLSIISTSNCGNPALRLFGFGPVDSNGFGFAYIIKADSITVCACTKHRQTQRYLNALESYYMEIENIHQEVLRTPVQATVDSLNKLNISESQNSQPDKPIESRALNYLLGGYGYFDVGEDEMKDRGTSPEPSFSDGSLFSLQDIEKKLRLAEY